MITKSAAPCQARQWQGESACKGDASGACF
jgi:hypothetical protein